MNTKKILKTAAGVMKSNAKQTLRTISKVPKKAVSLVGKAFPVAKALKTEKKLQSLPSNAAKRAVAESKGAYFGK